MVRHIDLSEAPAGLGGRQYHLQGPPRPPVGQTQGQKVLSASGPHGPEIAKPDAVATDRGRAVEEVGQGLVGQACMVGPRPSTHRPTGAEDQVGGPGQDRAGDPDQLGGIERTIAVHEAHDTVKRGRRAQACPTCSAETSYRFDDDLGTVATGHVPRAVRGTVVDHQGLVAGRHGRQEGRKGASLIEDGDHDYGHQVVLRDLAPVANAATLTNP